MTYRCARLGDSTEIVDHIGFHHIYTSIPDSKHIVTLIEDDINAQLDVVAHLGPEEVERSITNMLSDVEMSTCMAGRVKTKLVSFVAARCHPFCYT
jgi:hypothetical protein